MKSYYLLFFVLIFVSCKNEKSTSSTEKSTFKIPELTIETNDKGAEIIQELEEKTKAKKREASKITYLHQQDYYQIKRDCGWYAFTKIPGNTEKTDSLVLDNMGFTSYLNGKPIENLTDSEKRDLNKTLKTELFFAELIFGLNSPTTQKKYLQEEKINETAYKKVKIEFIEENYEQDYLTAAVFWINTATQKPDFVAVNFDEKTKETEFLKLENPRTIENILFFDYRVYISDQEAEIEKMAELFEEDKLIQKEVRKYEDIKVNLSGKSCD